MCTYADWKFAAIVVEKRKVNPVVYRPNDFYPIFAAIPLRFVLGYKLNAGTTNAIIYTDRLPQNSNLRALSKSIKQAIAANFGGLPYQIYHHPSESNCWIQIVDYCSWAIFRKWEWADLRTYNHLLPRLINPELLVTARGTTYYY